jgi:hypothetical protein
MSFNDITVYERGGRGADECTELASSVFQMTSQVLPALLGVVRASRTGPPFIRMAILVAAEIHAAAETTPLKHVQPALGCHCFG